MSNEGNEVIAQTREVGVWVLDLTVEHHRNGVGASRTIFVRDAESRAATTSW
jgi:hypothetical protein